MYSGCMCVWHELQHNRCINRDVPAQAKPDEKDDGADGAPAVERAEDVIYWQTHLMSA